MSSFLLIYLTVEGALHDDGHYHQYFRQLLQPLQQGAWFIIHKISHDIDPSGLATGLTMDKDEVVMLTSGIIRRRGEKIIIIVHLLEQLKLSLRHPNLTIHTTRCKLPNRVGCGPAYLP